MTALQALDTGLHGDEAARIRLAAHPGTPASLLHRLATDPAVMVRAAIAMNPAATPAMHGVLTGDRDERVRALLATKVAQLLPTLGAQGQSDAAGHARDTLAALMDDEAIRVRAAIADAVKALPDVPRELVLRLASDQALAVCDPVIRMSPLLTDADLLALVAAPPHPEAARSVAARPGLSAAVADAVAAQADTEAVRALLLNRSAAIQEATLDPALASQLRARLVTRHGDPAAQPPDAPRGDADLMPSLRRLHAAGGLGEHTLLDAARAGDVPRTAAILSVASGLPLAAVERAAHLRSAKALVSLAWRAGFGMRAATVVQAVLGRLGPGAMLGPAPGGGYPLTVSEMGWQIEVLGGGARV